MPTLIICRGLQGSGKSTFAEEWIAEEPNQRSRVNRDLIRLNYFNTTWNPEVENAVSLIEMETIQSIMVTSRDIISDNTNLANDRVLGYLRLADMLGYTVVFKDFDVDVDEVIRRDSLREKPVGEAVIRGYRDKYMPDGVFPAIPVLPM